MKDNKVFKTPCIALTTGEPAGIGPDICVMLAQQQQKCALIAIGDPDVLEQRAKMLGLPLTLTEVSQIHPPENRPSELYIVPRYLEYPCNVGILTQHSADYVLATLEAAAQGSIDKFYDAIVTAPISKNILLEAGHKFVGHTEFFAERARCHRVVMMLASKTMRVALATTHLPLREVADSITKSLLAETLSIVYRGLKNDFNIDKPRIAVAGLNPHAGENGYMGSEEQDIIIPVIESFNRQNMRVKGPFPADTLFTKKQLKQADAVLAMYHDQGLPVIKSHHFNDAVNVTLGLPFIRTSVDHGTAAELAGTGFAESSSLQAAVDMATSMAKKR